jgi:hypothetical protein
MFVQKQAYLVSVGDPIDLTMVDLLKLKDGQDRVKIGEIEVNHCPTKLMIADILTKPLEGILFKQLKEKMMGGASAPELWGSVGDAPYGRNDTHQQPH